MGGSITYSVAVNIICIIFADNFGKEDFLVDGTNVFSSFCCGFLVVLHFLYFN